MKAQSQKFDSIEARATERRCESERTKARIDALAESAASSDTAPDDEGDLHAEMTAIDARVPQCEAQSLRRLISVELQAQAVEDQFEKHTSCIGERNQIFK